MAISRDKDNDSSATAAYMLREPRHDRAGALRRCQLFALKMRREIERLSRSMWGEQPQALSLLRKLLERESLSLDAAAAVEGLCESLRDDGSLEYLLKEVLAETAERPLEILSMALKEYVTRKTALLSAGIESEMPDDNLIFNAAIKHDISYLGAASLRLTFDLMVAGRPGEVYWVKIAAHDGRNYIKTAAGHESWKDRSFKLRLASPDTNDMFSALMPLYIRKQVALCPALSCFIPYAALSKPEGVPSVSFGVFLLDGKGRKLASEWIEDKRLPLWAQGSSTFPSPQSLEIWPADGEYNARILHFERVKKACSDSGEYDLRCGLRLLGQEGRRFRLVFRALNFAGRPLEGGGRHIDMRVAGNVFTENFKVKLVVERGGDPARFIEVRLMDPQNKRLCGALLSAE